MKNVCQKNGEICRSPKRKCITKRQWKEMSERDDSSAPKWKRWNRHDKDKTKTKQNNNRMFLCYISPDLLNHKVCYKYVWPYKYDRICTHNIQHTLFFIFVFFCHTLLCFVSLSLSLTLPPFIISLLFAIVLLFAYDLCIFTTIECPHSLPASKQ